MNGPFLSHARPNGPAVSALKKKLAIVGITGWQDVDDLPIGVQSSAQFERAIASLPGFIFYATALASESETIRTIELPAAIDRKKKDPDFALVPVFAELGPKQTRIALDGIGNDRLDRLMDCNGPVRDAEQSLEKFHREVAHRYLDAILRTKRSQPVRVRISSFAPPGSEYDLQLDWRKLVGKSTGMPKPRKLEKIVEALRVVRQALIRSECTMPIELEANLPLPLATQVGVVWNRQSTLSLELVQRHGADTTTISSRHQGPTPALPWSTDLKTVNTDAGIVVAASVGFDVDRKTGQYAAAQGITTVCSTHIEGSLEPDQIAGIAAAIANKLHEAKGLSDNVHLVLRGPVSLAVLIGTTATAAVPFSMPRWDTETSAYGKPITLRCPAT
jgi:hypothetical protein